MFTHFFFIILHLIAILTSAWLLLVTIPLHIITAILVKNKAAMKQQTKLLKEQNEMLRRRIGK